MIPPIFILFECHSDKMTKELLKDLIKPLSHEGYNTLCIEVDSEMPEEKIIATSDNNLFHDTKLCLQTLNSLMKAGIDIEGKLSDVSFTKLTGLVGDEKTAEKIKNLPASIVFNNILKTSKKHSFSIQGIDSGAEIKKIQSCPISTRGDSLIQSESARIESMADNLFELYKAQKGVVYPCGALHSRNLIAKLKEKGLTERDIVCYFPYSPTTFDDDLDEMEEIKDQLLEENIYCIQNIHEIELLKVKILSEIKLKSSPSKL